MSMFDVYTCTKNKSHDKAIKRGFSWPALFFGTIWALVNKLYVIALLYVILSIGIVLLSQYVPTITTVLYFAIPIIVGYLGNSWKRSKLIKNGYTLLKTVYAPNTKDAILADPIGTTYENVSTTAAEWSSANDDLIRAITKGNTHPKVAVDIIKEIYNKGVNINAKNDRGRTALSIAKYHEVPTAVKAILVDAGAMD